MYKLVAVAGKLRGQEFELVEGENICGRDSGCDVHLPVQGISKKHFSVTVTGDTCYLNDLGSSNGTFLNGKIVKRATAENGDKLALPDLILQVVFIEEKKVIIKKTVTSGDDDDDDDDDIFKPDPMPDNIAGKVMWAFKWKLMPVIHGINEEYEWSHLFGILLALFSVATITLTIIPVLRDSREILYTEIAKRGSHYAEEIARINAQALEDNRLERVDTAFLDNEDGVSSYELFDTNLRIVRPITKLNEYSKDAFSVEAKDVLMNPKKKSTMHARKLSDGMIGIGKKIMAFDAKAGVRKPVGIIAIKFSPESLAKEAKRSTRLYLESLVTSGMVAIIFFGIIFYLTQRPLDELRLQIEEALRGKRKSLDSEYLMSSLNPLRDSINSVLQRMRELNTEGGDSEFVEEEEDDAYVATLKEFLRGSVGAAIVLDSQKNVVSINMEAEDLTGMRESAAEGMNLLDVAREQGFAATVLDLCENSASNAGTNQSSEYELSGIPHEIHVVALIGKDAFAKGFYITFIKEG